VFWGLLGLPSAGVLLHASVLLNRMPVIGHCRKRSFNCLSSLRALSDHVLELTPDGVLTYGGGYAECVVAAGHEAPGLGG